MNEALESREFSSTAQISYQYFYSQLCDVFVENSKYILADDATPEAKESAKQTLYTAIDGGLTMLHPIMPFITEHVWQSLPRRAGDETFSIMKAKYPEYIAEFDDPAAASAYELILDTSKAIRSILSQYGVKDQADIIIQTYDATSSATISSEMTNIKSLGGKNLGELSHLGPENKTPPSGCVVASVGAEAAVYLRVPKEVAIEQLEKAKASLEKAQENARRSQGIIAGPGWAEKVKPEVREQEEKRLREAESEAARLEEQVKEFEKLRLE